MAGKRFSRGISRGARRMSSWFDIVPANATMAASGGTVLHALTTAEKAKRPFTVVRTHLVLSAISDQLIASELSIGAYGLCVVTDQAIGQGVASVPTPVTDASSDQWFVHQWLMANFNFSSAIGTQADAGHIWTVDSKAMRKVTEDQDIIGVAEFSAFGDGVIVTAMGRLLIKEH